MGRYNLNGMLKVQHGMASTVTRGELSAASLREPNQLCLHLILLQSFADRNIVPSQLITTSGWAFRVAFGGAGCKASHRTIMLNVWQARVNVEHDALLHSGERRRWTL